MLNDFERKILRIMVNYAGQRRRLPRMDELENKTGRSRAYIHESLLELERTGHIAWGAGLLWKGYRFCRHGNRYNNRFAKASLPVIP